MRSLLQGLRSENKYKIDFSLVPLGIIIIEFSVFTTQLSKDQYSSLRNLIILRVLHTILMVILSSLLSRLFIRLKKTELNYRTLAITGTLVIGLGDFIHRFMDPALGVELVGAERRVGIILLQGCFWFPAFIIVGSLRSEIFHHFKEYEQRLIIATRARGRKSDEFVSIRMGLQDQIRRELTTSCNALIESISQVRNRSGNLAAENQAIQPHLLGDDLRKLSMKLETFGSEQQGSKILGQNFRSVSLLIKQFRILYATTARSAPLTRSAYALVLLALITPPIINYSALTEALISYPIMILAITTAAHAISKALASNSPHALRNSSILIYLTGFLPMISNLIGQIINPDPNTWYPIYITGLIVPISYYIFVKVLQVLHPRSLELIRNDELQASAALQEAVTKVVSDEFSHALSHRWAIFIHGKILTRLAATALKLETATQSGDTQTFNAAVDSLLNLLKNPDAEFEQLDTDLETEVSSRLDPWLGLLDVDLHIDHELKSVRNDRVRELGEVIEEIISNSMRHGKAQKVALRVIKSGNRDIQIIASDDATIAPPQVQSRYGLGTRIFNLASDGRWSITRVESGTEFKLTMAMEL
jgi:signal transduction histidine kinase